MNTASDVPDDEKALTSSDLVGLLKAASLTEFRPDNISDIGEEKFVKSNSATSTPSATTRLISSA